MKYNGTELKEFTSDRPVVFDPPRKMLVWDTGRIEASARAVQAYIPGRHWPVIAEDNNWMHCAEIPEEPKPRRATNMELAKWLAQGRGLVTERDSLYEETFLRIVKGTECQDCPDCLLVRKWDDEEWHEPTADYMGLEG